MAERVRVTEGASGQRSLTEKADVGTGTGGVIENAGEPK